MNIHFYLNNEEETHITSFFDMASNPFNVGDIINLNVEELYPADYDQYVDVPRITIIEENKKLQRLFGKTKVRIVREGKWVSFKETKEPKLVIEFHCNFI